MKFFNPKRAAKWIKFKITGIWSIRLRIGSIILGLITVISFAATAWPASSRDPWIDWGLTKLKVGWIAPWVVIAAAAVYLKFLDRFTKQRKYNEIARRCATEKSLITANTLDELFKSLEKQAADPNATLHLRESLLVCIKVAVEEVFGADASDHKIAVTLLCYTDNKFDKMTVIARSTKERGEGQIYESNKLIAHEAIEKAYYSTEDDVTNSSKFKAFGRRRYKSILAVPITKNNRAYGAVSIDSEKAYAFYGREVLITIAIHPFLKGIAMTYGDKDVYRDCKYDPTHF